MNQVNAVSLLTGAYENATLDFKEKYDFTDKTDDKRYELAKDIAAFANAMGGTIVVGAVETMNKLDGFKPIANPGEYANAIAFAVEKCRPKPIARHVEIELDESKVQAVLGRPGPATKIIAVNVEPTIDGPVGVQTWALSKRKQPLQPKDGAEPTVMDLCQGNEIEGAYRFPLRVTANAIWLTPEELSTLMNVHERRMLLALEAIPHYVLPDATGPQRRVNVWIHTTSSNLAQPIECDIVGIHRDTMMVTFRNPYRYASDTKPFTCQVPIALVRAIWEAGGYWHIQLHGSMLDANGVWIGLFRPALG